MAKKVNVQDDHPHPLAEVFGFPTRNQTQIAKKHRDQKLCPYNNIVSTCTKDRKNDPLGVCSIYYSDTQTVICPVRFREDWRICSDAASFIFPKAKHWSFVKEVRLKEKSGKSAGNIDVVLVSHDQDGKILDFGAVEVQAVYISGNIRNPFDHYMADPAGRAEFDWSNEDLYPRPDYLSSSRKRLVPQMTYKGKILRAWGKKMVVAIDKPFFSTLPDLPTRPEHEAEICWLVYQLEGNKMSKYKLDLKEKIFTGFDDTISRLDTPEIGDQEEFVESLQEKLTVELATLKAKGFLSYSDFLKHPEKGRSPELSI